MIERTPKPACYDEMKSKDQELLHLVVAKQERVRRGHQRWREDVACQGRKQGERRKGTGHVGQMMEAWND